MAKANLPVNFKDDILKENMNGKRRFKMIQNGDGTVSFDDVTEYTQVGSTFGAAQINATNEAVNNAADASKIIDSLETIKANTQSGYIAGALAVKKLNSNLDAKLLWTNESTGSAFKEQTISISSTFDYCIIVFVHDTSSRLEEHAIIMVPRNSTQYYSAIGSRDQIRRDVKYSDTGIFIGNGIYLPNTIMNGYLIPYKIYGINITL